ncbi:MAG TPA: RNA-binding transcriptional accessory protein [Prevotella sp.]|nr:Tex family protein [Prevotella sp.]HCD65635.1 RNA-binding transcriptional accessory protein [Prevotella sp.]
MNPFSKMIAAALALSEKAVENTLELLEEGCTIPFISRYRKEKTGNMDEVKIEAVAQVNEKYKEMAKRKETILKTIGDQGKLSAELQQRIDNCWDATELEDIYLPFKPKRRTRAQVAREQGLEPLAQLLLLQRERNPEQAARKFVGDKVSDVAAALQGAKDIIAETVSENEQSRNQIRGEFRRGAIITSKVVAKKKDEEDAQRFSDYFDFSEPLKRCSSHRLLAMRRGEAAGFLRVSISADEETCITKLKRHYVHGFGECQALVGEAVDDAFKRLLKPSIETEFAAQSKQKADEEAIVVFAENLRQLLLAAPLGQKRVMAVDPGFANGCKTACLDALGNLVHHEIVYPHPPRNKRMEATASIKRMVRQYQVEAMAVGNGTASRETSEWLNEIDFEHPVDVYVVSEDGASIYSASKIAREEFPDEDVTVRGAVSIGRRLMDPLAELVKIDPKSIGVGQYQYDVDQSQLKKSLDSVVMSCVNSVGVNLNTASQHLLTYVSGLGPTLAKNIVEYRRENGAFSSRSQLKKVPRLGPSAYEQCAGFLRIPGARNPLDNSAVHPERYSLVETMAKDQGVTVKQLVEDKALQKKIDIRKYVSGEVGMPTLTDIMAELDKPGLDPRGEVEKFEFDASIKTIEDLQVGMVVPGIVTNITKFGAFVDIGVHNDGLVHVSQMANRYVSDPSEVVKLHEHVMVRVTEVDLKRKRIALSMK